MQCRSYDFPIVLHSSYLVKCYLHLTTGGCKDSETKLGIIHQTHNPCQFYSLSGTQELGKTYGKVFKSKVSATDAYRLGELALSLK